ncbi:MAG: hypothetical protein AMJ72_01660 [Acidithiobacillales bacterium SM1_46]|nr:MAG: hypothetical protein AMJ72_01660 [Acidithiobacillales bacterium SM1_46]
MRIVYKARNHVPMQVWHLIAERREIDLVRLQHRTQDFFRDERHPHEVRAVCVREIGHLLYVLVPDHSAEGRVICVTDKNYAQTRVAP